MEYVYWGIGVYTYQTLFQILSLMFNSFIYIGKLPTFHTTISLFIKGDSNTS